ncbi:hypothetical protein [Serratia marcescens]|uniref:hypothetical protein n=2 Tax=Serratia marcescens TaxID=615 RepID=UPI0015720F2D|nr:hypothetical protein [Serratia marcescens]NSM13562.1 hypothetical protein [Serratia marcescens]NSM97224.1 hypothetical protein [Serratia marcescens]CAF2602879.1 hypothetical protein AI2872V1_3564 [Serratia marcescens]CAF2688832.1 hypothetical protein AI2884V1_3564 [Serratia marcescens]CAH5375349.1 hypothetical protein AI2872V1_3564 [Serratia marcescens]
MQSDIFLEDFEMTENTEKLHSILGRGLVIATRFDSLCDHTLKLLEFKSSFSILLPEKDFQEYVDKLFSKFSSLSNNIDALTIDNSYKSILHEARKARNEVVHSVGKGLTGCLDGKVDEEKFKSYLSDLIFKVADGDFVISTILSIINYNKLPNYKNDQYQKKIVNWTLGK